MRGEGFFRWLAARGGRLALGGWRLRAEASAGGADAPGRKRLKNKTMAHQGFLRAAACFFSAWVRLVVLHLGADGFECGEQWHRS